MMTNVRGFAVVERSDQSKEDGIKVCSTIFQPVPKSMSTASRKVIFSIRSSHMWGDSTYPVVKGILFMHLILLCRWYIIELYGNCKKSYLLNIVPHPHASIRQALRNK